MFSIAASPPDLFVGWPGSRWWVQGQGPGFTITLRLQAFSQHCCQFGPRSFDRVPERGIGMQAGNCGGTHYTPLDHWSELWRCCVLDTAQRSGNRIRDYRTRRFRPVGG